WIEATRDIGTKMLSGVDPATVFRLMADESRDLSGAETILIAVRQELDDAEGPVDELDVVATAGDGPEAFMAAVPTAGSVIGDVF
ncbi:histidine kinase, partial [Mycobacterium sp. ITM-2017-0098]